MKKSSYKILTCFNKVADRNSDGHRAITRSALRRSSVSYWWTSSSKKSKPEKALTARKRRYCAVVELTILRETTSNRTASIFFNPKSSASGACKQKIGTFYWINDFLYFFERDIRWTRKIKTVTRSNGTAVFSPRFLIVRRPFYGTEFETFFWLLLYGKVQRGQCVSTTGGYLKT